ncbi:hypothetical protein AB0L41_45115 [Amycolatopsis mediterranei]|uniref:hypothetical protein n=1 Tax=Amycolatopsis mediterranei TaxID=33910 RepID=UPI003426817B
MATETAPFGVEQEASLRRAPGRCRSGCAVQLETCRYLRDVELLARRSLVGYRASSASIFTATTLIDGKRNATPNTTALDQIRRAAFCASFTMSSIPG